MTRSGANLGGFEMFFSVRDVVKLRYGGPAMIVEAVAGERVSTLWFHAGQLRRADFLASNLTKTGAPVPSFTEALAAEREKSGRILV